MNRQQFSKLKPKARLKRLDKEGDVIQLTSEPRSDGTFAYRMPSHFTSNTNSIYNNLLPDTRNSTRIGSLNGVWSLELYIKTDVGGAWFKCWYVINFLCDPTVQYSCFLEDCDMLKSNQICAREGSEIDYRYKCNNMQYDISGWSDTAMLTNIGYEVNVPGYHDKQSTGRDFVGEYSLLMVQHNLTEYNINHEPPSNTHFVDVYSIRYTNSSTVQNVFKPKDCDIFSEDNFETMAGKTAVNWTIHYQTFPEGIDIYEPYYDTCDNGDAHPTLPRITFEFSRQNYPPFSEIIDLIIDYRLFVAPSIDDTDTWETLIDLGFPVSGPYCYLGELRGYTIDLSFDSKEGNDFIQYEHACIEGDPCLSTALSKCTSCTEIEVRESSGGTTIQVGILIWLILSITFIGSFFIISCVNNMKHRRRIRRLEVELGTLGSDLAMRESAETYSLMNNVDGDNPNVIAEPLLYSTSNQIEGDEISLNSNASHPLSFRPRRKPINQEEFDNTFT